MNTSQEEISSGKLETKKFVDDGESDESDNFYASNSVFKLTDLGKLVGEKIWNEEIDDLTKNNISVIKKQYGGMTLNSLLRYVYDTYPDMTVNSEIKHSVYGK